jgi:hypothetical protein
MSAIRTVGVFRPDQKTHESHICSELFLLLVEVASCSGEENPDQWFSLNNRRAIFGGDAGGGKPGLPMGFVRSCYTT